MPVGTESRSLAWPHVTRRASARTSARLVAVLLVAAIALTLAGSEPAGGDPDGAATTLPATTPPATTLPATTLPGTTLPATTLPAAADPTPTVPPVPDGIEEPPVLPDLAVRRAPGGSWLGAGRPASRVPVTIDAGARAGQRVTFVFRVGHDGPDTATIVLTGRGRDLHAGVVWRLDGRDVTEAVDRGDLRVLVDPGAHRDLTLGVTLRQFAPAGFALTRTLTAEALGGARDRVRAVVTRGPSPVRFHDVGLALGLPRHTHSFDVDAAPVDGDGVDDLVISTHGRVEVFLNHQPGLETVLARSGGDIHACAVGDADGDGRADVYCTVGAENGTGSKRNRLWLQQPEGGFGPNRAAHYGVDDPYGRGRHPTFVDLDRRLGTDLFVGNENPRADDNVSLNRTFLHAETAEFSDVRLGMRSDIGGLCAQAADQDGNGWDDLLVCGGAGLATVGWNPGDNQLHLFRNLRRHDGGRRLVDVAPRLGIDLDGVQAARLAHLDGDGHLDLVVVRRDSVSVWPGAAGGTFRFAVFHEDLQAGHAITLADVDGRLGLDLFVVQACGGPRGVNLADRLYLDAGPGWDWEEARLPTRVAGCGDTADALDVDGDGIDDLVVGNGQWSAEGPVQVLTSGRYWG